MSQETPHHERTTLPATPASTTFYHHATIVAQEVEKRYQEGILAYIDVLARYEEEIGLLKEKLQKAKLKALPMEEQLTHYAEEIRIEERLLERLNSDFLQKVGDYEAFETEYSPLMDQKSVTHLKRTKHKEIAKLQSELEESETKLLNLELERLNQVELLEPIKTEIEQIEHTITELEHKKRYFETTQLQQMHTHSSTATASLPSPTEVTDVAVE